MVGDLISKCFALASSNLTVGLQSITLFPVLPLSLQPLRRHLRVDFKLPAPLLSGRTSPREPRVQTRLSHGIQVTYPRDEPLQAQAIPAMRRRSVAPLVGVPVVWSWVEAFPFHGGDEGVIIHLAHAAAHDFADVRHLLQ